MRSSREESPLTRTRDFQERTEHLTPTGGGKASATRALPGVTDVLRGILLMCAGVSTFPFMNAAVKLLTAHYPAAQITWARFTGHLIVMLVVFLPHYRWSLLRTRRPAVQSVARC